jgi:chloride channel 7
VSSGVLGCLFCVSFSLICDFRFKKILTLSRTRRLFFLIKNIQTTTDRVEMAASPPGGHGARRAVSFESDLERLLLREEEEEEEEAKDRKERKAGAILQEEEEEEEEEQGEERETTASLISSPLIKGQYRRLIPRKQSLFLGPTHADDQRREEEEEEEEEQEEEERRRQRRRETWESLDYAKVDSMWSRLKFKTTSSNVLLLERWSNSTFIGVIVGSVAFAMMRLIDMLYTWRVDTILTKLNFPFVVRTVFFCLASALFALTSASLTLIEPTAAGAGVSYVVAELNGVSSPKGISLKSGIVKIIGTIFSVSSGLAVGPEGPLVHIGAIIGSAFARGGSGRRQWRALGDSDFRDILSSGAAAGLASAFGSPIGGVLFSSEEASSFWSHDTTRKALLCSTLAVFVLAALNGSIGRPFGLLQLDFAEEEKHWELFELGAFLLLAILSGILGAMIIVAVSKVARCRPNSKIGRVGEATLVAFMICATQLLLSIFLGRCIQYNTTDTRKTFPTSIGVALSCNIEKEGSYNDLASLLLGSRDNNLKYFLSGRAKDATSIWILIYSFLFQLVAIVFSAECALPAGLFLPTLTWGAMLGNIFCKVGEILLKRNLSGGAYALVGATAALAGVFRGSISLVVIILEGTSQLNFLLPLLLCVFVANKFASFIAPSFYESQLKRRNIPYLHALPPKEACVSETEATLTAGDICAAPAVVFQEIERVSNIEEILKTTTHNGFPIVKNVGYGEKRLIGLILRSQLLTLLSRRAFIENIIFYEQEGENNQESAISSSPLRSSSSKSLLLDVSTSSDLPSELRFRSSQQREAFENLEIAMRTFHQRKLFTERSALGVKYIESIGLTENEKKSHVILSDFMMLAPISVTEQKSVERVWEIFRHLGLRHLCVVDSKNNIKGMITREDLYKLQH